MIATIYARTLLATLGLLACATTASAECAWVLWEAGIVNMTGPANSIPVWASPSPREAFTSLEACKPHEISRQRIWTNGGHANPTIMCLPDTVDPRGPKGSP